MSKYFIPLWLPLSLGVHLVLLVFLQFTQLNATQIPGEQVIEVYAVKPFQLTPQAPPLLPQPEKMRAPKVLPTEPPQKKMSGTPKEVGISNPQSQAPTGDLGPKDPTKTRKGPSGIGNFPKAAKAPATTSGTNAMQAPPGDPKGLGMSNTGPTGTQEGGGQGGGPTLGVSVESLGKAYYPKDALNDGRSGTVRVLVDVRADGIPSRAEISMTSGSSDLDTAAKKAALRSRFSPALRDGKAVDSSVILTYRFANGRVTSD